MYMSTIPRHMSFLCWCSVMYYIQIDELLAYICYSNICASSPLLINVKL